MDAARSQSVFCSAKHSCTIAFIFLVAAYLGAAASALADQSERTWTFDLATPGSYKVQVEHRAKGADRSSTKVHYTIQAGMQSQSRDLDVLTDHPFINLEALARGLKTTEEKLLQPLPSDGVVVSDLAQRCFTAFKRRSPGNGQDKEAQAPRPTQSHGKDE